jgi:hypothetical protein
VSIFRDAVIGPVKFYLVSDSDLGEDPDPLNLSHWHFEGKDYDCPPTRLFINQKNAKLFAEGARAARIKLIEAWREDMSLMRAVGARAARIKLIEAWREDMTEQFDVEA